MALADATVRVILDLSRFDRDLETKVAAAARRAGRRFEAEFAKTAKTAGSRWAKDFQEQANQSMSSAGTRAGTQFGGAVRRAARPTGRITGRELGEQLRGGLLQTATLTGRQFGRGVLSGSITEAGSRIGQRLGRAIGVNLTVAGFGPALRRQVEAEAEPGMLAAARTVAGRFGSALGAAMGAVSIGRVGLLVGGISLLVSEATQLAGAIAPALQAVGLFPAVASVATASITTLVVAFQGMGDALAAAASGDAEELAEALKALTPAAASVVQEFGALMPRLTEVRRAVQEAFFSELTGSLTQLGDALIGPVQRGMTATASAAGRMAAGLADVFSQTRNANTIEEIFGSAAGAFDQMNVPMQNFTQGMLDFVRATLPAFDQLIATLGTGATRFGAFLSSAAASGQAMAWVNEAITTISQLGRIAASAGRLVGTIFSAAEQAGGNYLLTLNNALIATRQFLAVGEGRAALVNIFSGLREVLRGLAEPLRAAVVAIGQVSVVAGSMSQAMSSGLAAAIRGIGKAVENAGPGLTKFATSVGGALSALGDVLPSIGSSLGRLLSAAAPLVGVFGLVANVAAAVLSVFSSLPGPLLTVIAAFVGMRALGLPNLLTQIQARATGLGGAFGGLTSTFQANLASLTAMRMQQQVTNNAMNAGIPSVSAFGGAIGGLADRARAAGGALGGGLLSGVSSLIGALGGGIGIALTAASVFVGLWAQEQAKADQAVAEHNSRVRQLGSTLDKVTGSITNATRAQAQQSFATSDLSDSATRLGLSIDSVANAATGGQVAQRGMLEQLRASARGALENAGAYEQLERRASNVGVSTETLLDAMLGNADAIAKVNRGIADSDAQLDSVLGAHDDLIPDQRALGAAINQTADDLAKQAEAIKRANAQYGPATRLADTLATAMGTLADNSSSAADKSRALDSALRLLNGGTMELADAQKASADAIASGRDQMQTLIDKYNIAGQSADSLGISTEEFAARQAELGHALFDSAGQINFASERARGLYDVSKALRQTTLDQTAAVVDNAQKTGGDMAAAHQRAAEMMKASRQQVIDWALAAGFGAADAERFADSMGLLPENVTIALEMEGVPAIISGLAAIEGDIRVLPDKKSIRLDSNARAMRGDLEDLGFLVEDIPGSKDIKVTPHTEEAAAALRAFITQQITSRDPDLNVGANTDPAKWSVQEIEAFINDLPAVVEPKLDTEPIIAEWQSLLLGGLTAPPGTPTVTPGVDSGPVTTWFGSYLQGLVPAPGDPTVTPGVDPRLVEGWIGLLGAQVPPGEPTITPGVNEAPAEDQLEGLLEGQLGPIIRPYVDEGPTTSWFNHMAEELNRIKEPEITPEVNPGPASLQLDGLRQPITPQVVPAANTLPAQGQLQALLFQINNTHATGPVVGGNVGPATGQLALLLGLINRSQGNVAVGANTGPGIVNTNALVGYANSRYGAVDVGANTGAAYDQVNQLVRYINSRTATVDVSTSGSVRVAEGGLFKYFAGGGINTMRPMPANRAEIVPPKTMRVIGDRARGDEAFIPLVNSARSRSILQAAASRLGLQVSPREERPTATTRTTTVEAGAIVVQAPYSDPYLVARAVVNELAREAVP